MTRSQGPEQKPERVRRREEEMERGRQVAARAERRALLERWEKAHRISLRYDIDGDRRQAWLWQAFDRTLVDETSMLLAEEKDHNEWPSEGFVAQVALGLQALTGSLEAARQWDWPVPKEQHDRAKQFAKDHVIDWSNT